MQVIKEINVTSWFQTTYWNTYFTYSIILDNWEAKTFDKLQYWYWCRDITNFIWYTKDELKDYILSDDLQYNHYDVKRKKHLI